MADEDKELQDQIKDGDKPPDVDDGNIDLSQMDVFDDKQTEEPVEKGGEPKPKKEKAQPEVVEGDAKDQIIKSLEARINDMDKSLKRLHYDDRHKKKEDGKKDDSTPALTDEQLLKFMEDAGDDKASLLRVMKYAAEQAAKGAKVSALTEADVIAKKREVDKNFRNVFKDKWDDPTSDVRTDVDGVKSEFDIVDHPYGDLFGVGVSLLRALPNLQKQWFEAGKAEATKGLSEEERLKGIEQNKLGDGKKKGGDGKKGNSGLSAAEMEIAKRLGYGVGNPKKSIDRYASILKSQRGEA